MGSNMIELIKVLRERTGAGNLDCKKALEACEMDVDKAVDYLREKGVAKAAKKASRIAAEGLCDIKVCDKCGHAAIVEVNCETDFVARGELFQKLVSETAQDVLENKYDSLEAAKEANKERYLTASIAIGEKLDFRRFEVVAKEEGQIFGTYIHNGSKIGVIVVLEGTSEEDALGIAMHIAANNPSYVSEKSIPADVIEHERKIALEAAKQDPKLAGKPEAMLNNIVNGKVNKLLGEQVLLNQAYLLNPEITVRQLLEQSKESVVKFVRFAVGEGIEKRQENFAEEVMKQM